MKKQLPFFRLPARVAACYQGKNILVTGGLGFIGSVLVNALAEVACKITILSHSSRSSTFFKKSKGKIRILNGDVSIRNTWEPLLPKTDFLFHLAALEYDRIKFNLIRDWQVNTLSLVHLLEVCRKKDYRPKIIFSSSANLFGLGKKAPVNEHHQSESLCAWSLHKLMAEEYLRIYFRKHGIGSVSLRLTNVYGPTVNPTAMSNVVINRVILKALKGEPLVLFGNKNCLRDYVFVSDVVRAFLHAGTMDNLSFDGSFYIIGSGEGITIDKVWQLIAKKVKALTNKKVAIKVDRSVELELLDRRNFIADTRLFQKKTGWKPQVFISKGIDLTIAALVSKKERKCKILKRKR